MKQIARSLILLFCLLHSAILFAGELKLHPAFSSNMVLQRDQPVNVFGSGKPGAAVSVSFAGQTLSTTVQPDGKWKVVLDPLKADTTPAVLTVKSDSEEIECKNVLVGDVWFCSGQSNMARSLSSFNQLTPNIASISRPLVRIYITAHEVAKTPAAIPLPPSKNKEADLNQWQESKPDILMQASPLACFFADKVSDELNIPVGILISCTGATAIQAYCPQELLTRLNLPTASLNLKEDYSSANEPSLCYNTYTHPYLDVTFKGFLWYQGESSRLHATQYRTLFPALIADWRNLWGEGDFPFLYVQIAPCKIIGPEIREAQLLSLSKTTNTAMTVITDWGDATANMHPIHKEPVGVRLALAARVLAYGQSLEYSGPLFKGAKTNGDSFTIYFDHTGQGLMAKDGPLKGFAIAGPDKVFVPAKAEIVNDTVVVSAPQITNPAAVRYGWANVPDVNLFNKNGLPASPFRTDKDN